MMKSYRLHILVLSIMLISVSLLGFSKMGNNYAAFLKPSEGPAATVEMTNTMKFNPDTVHIKTGETVQWNNTSLLVHSVTGDPSQSTVEGSAKLPEGAKAFNSGMMDPEQTFEHTFSVAGTYQYFCIPHEGAKMYGWVIVEK